MYRHALCLMMVAILYHTTLADDAAIKQPTGIGGKSGSYQELVRATRQRETQEVVDSELPATLDIDALRTGN